jgi:hypothetical protein
MRDDMTEIIIERPRWGSRMSFARRNRRFDPKVSSRQNPEASRFSLGMKRAAREARMSKMLNENLSPLRRYLESQVNRPWDKVWSDICENLKPTSTVQQHVRDHIRDFVEIDLFNKNGVLWVHSRFRGIKPLSESDCRLYVDPRTGILRRNKHYKTWSQKRRETAAAAAKHRATRMRELGPMLQAHRFDDGSWWEVRLAPIPTRSASRSHGGYSYSYTEILAYLDVVHAAKLTRLPAEDLYGRYGVYAANKRQLSRKEVAALGLPH